MWRLLNYVYEAIASDSGGGPEDRGWREELKTEHQWLREAKKNPKEFVKIYDKYLNQIYGFIFGKVPNHVLAEDMTSQTFLQAQDHLQEFEWRGIPLGAWLRQIARNFVRLHYSRRKPETSLDQEEEILDIPCPGKDPLAELIFDEDQKLLYECMGKLDQLGRDIFMLRYQNDRKVREIAETLEIPEGTVKARLHRDGAKVERMLLERHRVKPGGVRR